jgi:hypothetical protein
MPLLILVFSPVNFGSGVRPGVRAIMRNSYGLDDLAIDGEGLRQELTGLFGHLLRESSGS